MEEDLTLLDAPCSTLITIHTPCLKSQSYSQQLKIIKIQKAYYHT